VGWRRRQAKMGSFRKKRLVGRALLAEDGGAGRWRGEDARQTRTIGDSFMERLFYYSGRGGKCQGANLAGLELVGEVIEAGFELGDALGETVAFGAGGEALFLDVISFLSKSSGTFPFAGSCTD